MCLFIGHKRSVLISNRTENEAQKRTRMKNENIIRDNPRNRLPELLTKPKTCENATKKCVYESEM